MGLWGIALHRNRLVYSAAFGAALMLACFFAYNLLVLGALLAGLAAMHIVGHGWRGVMTVARHAALAAGVFVGLYGVLNLMTGLNPIAVFTAALANQKSLLRSIDRPYPATVLFDLADFALGSGWIGLLLAIFFLASPASRGQRTLAGLCLGELALVAVLGLLPGETARVWMFLLPVLMVPVGLELAGWSFGPRMAVYLALCLLSAAICQNLQFIVVP